MVHGTRLKLFRNRDSEVTVAAKEYLAYLDDELRVVHSFNNLRQREDISELRVTWKGFEDGESTWELYIALLEDVPETLRAYLYELTRTGTPSQQ
jgi:hypothetical protein